MLNHTRFFQKISEDFRWKSLVCMWHSTFEQRKTYHQQFDLCQWNSIADICRIDWNFDSCTFEHYQMLPIMVMSNSNRTRLEKRFLRGENVLQWFDFVILDHQHHLNSEWYAKPSISLIRFFLWMRFSWQEKNNNFQSYQLHFLPKQQYIVLLSIDKLFDKLDQQSRKYVDLIDFDIAHLYTNHVAIKRNSNPSLTQFSRHHSLVFRRYSIV